MCPHTGQRRDHWMYYGEIIGKNRSVAEPRVIQGNLEEYRGIRVCRYVHLYPHLNHGMIEDIRC